MAQDQDSTSRPAERYDAVVVGASLAGCTAALLLGRAGLRVAVVEQRPDPAAFKRVCGHFVQGSAMPTLRRLGVLDDLEAAGAVRSHTRVRTRFGDSVPPAWSTVERALNLRREKLDPLMRRAAAEAPGVEMVLGRTVTGILRDEAGACSGVEASDRSGRRRAVRARLVVAADGRDSRVAELAGVESRVSANGRFSYGAYYEGPAPAGAPDGTVWLLDPAWAAAFPTDDGLTMYACMPTLDRVDEFRRDPAGALEAFVAGLPGAPPIGDSRRIGPPVGKLRMPNLERGPVAPGLALIGDAALATDPLWGVGCGWAFQTAEWLADAVAPALLGDAPLERALARYRRTYRRRLKPHVRMIHGYATGRPFDGLERALYRAGPRDERVADALARVGSRTALPPVVLAPRILGRIVRANLRPSRGQAPQGSWALAAG